MSLPLRCTVGWSEKFDFNSIQRKKNSPKKLQSVQTIAALILMMKTAAQKSLEIN